MDDKRPIDRLRDSSGQGEVGTEEDGAIIEMKTIGGRLLIIKERSIYEMFFADTIDPERTNINLPQTITKLIIDKGTESETVARTFLTACTLFRREYMETSIDCDKVISLTIDMLSEISILEKEIKDYQDSEDKVITEYEKRKIQKGSCEIPSIVNLDTRCKTIFQKVDHVEQILMDIIIRFYPNLGLTKQSHFPKFYEVMKEKYGETDPFVEFIDKTLYPMRVTRELRNGLDHRLENTKVTDFEMKIDGNIISPTIELNYKKVILERIPLSELFKITIVNTLEIIEKTFAYLAGKNLKTGGMPYQVRLIPEEERKHKFVNYGIWMPIGDGGYYSQ